MKWFNVLTIKNTSLVALTCVVTLLAVLPAAAQTAANSKIAFARYVGTNYDIFVMNSDGSGQTNITNSSAADEFYPTWSPDRTKIAYHRSSVSGNNYAYDIWVMTVSGTGQTNLTNDPDIYDYAPAWSPDGTKIAYTSYAVGDNTTGEIWVMNAANGTGKLNLTNNAAEDTDPSWSPDGARIAFQRQVPIPNTTRTQGDIFVMNANGSGQTNLTNSTEENSGPAWSPNALKIAYSTYASADMEIYVMNADGASPVNLTNNPADDHHPAWAPDSTKIAFLRYVPIPNTPDAQGEVFVMDANGGGQINRTNNAADDADPAWGSAAGPSAPINVSVNPNSGSSNVGVARTLSAQYNDPNGATDLAETRILVQTSINGANALYVYYNRSTNLMYLADNAGTAWLGGFAPGSTNADGSARIFSNSQGSLNITASSTSVSADGKTLTVNYSLTPASTFNGTKNIYLYTRDKSNLVDGWDALGTWAITVPAAPPVNVSVSPNSGSSAVNVARTLAAQYNDANGATDLAETRILVNATLNGANALYVYYNRSTNLMYLADNAGTAWLGGFAPGSTNADGSARIFSNSQGSLNITASSTSVSADGKTLTVNYSLTPLSTFTGTKNLYLYTRDKSNLIDGWDALGTWAITVPTAPPVNVSVSPNSGSSAVDAARTLAAQYNDANGATDLAETHLLVNSSINGANGLYVLYNRNNNLMYLRNNAGNAWLGGFAPGSTNADGSARIIRDVDAQGNLIGKGSLNITASSTSVSADGQTLTVNYNLTPAATFGGTKNIYLYSRDKSNLIDGWDNLGTWTVAVPAAPPVNVSVSPNSGSSAVDVARTVAAQYNDANGATDLFETHLLVNSSITGANGLYVLYNRNSNLMYLRNNAGNAWLGGFAPGSTNADGSARIIRDVDAQGNLIGKGSLNITASSTSVSADGKTLTVNYSLTPAATFTGTKNIYLYSRDKTNLVDGWDTLGTWTITSAPAATSGTRAVSSDAASPVGLSSARVVASSQSVVLSFNGALDTSVASEAARYQVAVNGGTVEVTGVTYNAGSQSVTLGLSGPLQVGDSVAACWNELRDKSGASLSGCTGSLVAR